MQKYLVVFSLCLAATTHALVAQSTGVSFDSGSQAVFNVDGTTPLSGGTAADGDGFVLQLGYYSNATVNNWFAGTFIPLAGEGAANSAIVPNSSPAITYNQISIGDLTSNGAGDGTFALSLVFSPGDPNTGNNLPPANTPLALRFFNSTTIGTSTHYNAVSSNSWQWVTPATPPGAVTISLDDPLAWYSIVVEGQPNSAFSTSVAVPEPSTYALLATGIGALAFIRRRQKAAK